MLVDYVQGEVIVSFGDDAGPQFSFGSIHVIPLLIAEGFKFDSDKALRGLCEYWEGVVSAGGEYDFDGNNVNLNNTLVLPLGPGDIPEWEVLLDEKERYYGTTQATS